MTEERRIALASAALASAVVGGVIGAYAAPALGATSVDARFVAVLLGAALPLLGAYVVRPDAKHRRVAALLALPFVLTIPLDRSAITVTWLSGSTLCLGVEAVFHAGRLTSRQEVSRARRVASATVVVLPSIYLLVAVGIVVVNTQLAIVPARIVHQWPWVGPDERAVTLETSDGYAIRGTYAPGEGDLGVVLVHGVSDGRDRWIEWAKRLRAAGAHSLRIDDRAHGTSDGAVCTYGQRGRADVRAAARFMLRQPGVSRLALVGTSMGAGTILAASGTLEADAYVLLAPTSSYPALVRRRTALLGPFRGTVLAGSAWVARGMGQTPMMQWRPRDFMTEVRPILVFHGSADRTVPFALSRELARRHPNVQLVTLDGVGHDEIPSAVLERAWPRVAERLAL